MDMTHCEREHMRRHREDVDRIVAIAEGYGWDITPRQAYRAWAANSESNCASWLILDSDDDNVWGNVAGYVREIVGETVVD